MHSLAQHLQSQGRGNDTVLVHMTPREVGGLQALAQSAGGTLTRNPTTGLPEAGFLDSILPMIAGVAGGAIGIDPWMAAAGVGAITGIATGNLEKGLMSGLGAYGGATLGRTFNPEGTFLGQQLGTAIPPPTPSLTTINAAPAGAAAPPPDPYYQMANSPAGLVAPSASPVTQTINVEEPGIWDKFSAAASAGITSPGIAKFAPYAAGLGLATPFLGSSSSGLGALKPTEPKKLPPPRMFNRRPTYPVNRDPRDSSEFMFFPPEVPYYPAYADGGTVEARPRYAPDVAAPAGYAAQAPARSYVEQLYNFPRATNVPKLVKPTAETAALQTQYPTATKAQLSEYERAIAGGGDPSATRSLMQAYGPTSGIKELQPWSPDFKGFDYARSRPVDAFGNPVGWELPAKTAPTMGADGVPSGWDPRDWENMKNFDPGSPSDEYILNNPWTYGMTSLGGNVMPGEVGVRAAERSSQGPGIAQAQALYESNKKVEAQRQAAMAANAADVSRDEYGAIYASAGPEANIIGNPSEPSSSSRYVAPWPSSPSGTGSNFLNFLNQNMAAPRSTSTAAPTGPGLSDIYSGNRTLGSLLGFSSQPDPNAPQVNLGLGQALNAATGYLGLPGTVIDFLRNAYGGGLASAPGTNTLGVLGNTITSPGIGAQLGAGFNRWLGGTNPNKAAGGVNLEDGSFVVDARTVSELGNGSSSAGQELLARMGGKPIKGPGDGVSDSIRANIGGKQEARVARDEVKFSPEAVKRVGGGNPKKGADRLYAMMRKAEKARKTASRGKDTGLRALVGEK